MTTPGVSERRPQVTPPDVQSPRWRDSPALPGDAVVDVGIGRWEARLCTKPVDRETLPDRSTKRLAKSIELVGLDRWGVALPTLHFERSDVQVVATPTPRQRGVGVLAGGRLLH